MGCKLTAVRNGGHALLSKISQMWRRIPVE